MVQLYGVAVQTINEHVFDIYADEEQYPEATIRNLLIVQTEGTRQVKRLIDFYNLPMILAVGFRVRSKRGTNIVFTAEERMRFPSSLISASGQFPYFLQNENSNQRPVTRGT